MTTAWKLKATVFSRSSNQLIDYISTNQSQIPNRNNLQSGANYFYASNIAEANTKGIEFESWLSTTIGKQTSLRWSMGYTYLNTTNNEDAISVYLSSHAKHLMTSQFIIANPNWEVSLSGLYKSRNAVISSEIQAALGDSYQIWSSRFRLHLTKEISAQIQVHNLWDVSYQNVLGSPMPGRWLSAGVKISL